MLWNAVVAAATAAATRRKKSDCRSGGEILDGKVLANRRRKDLTIKEPQVFGGSSLAERKGESVKGSEGEKGRKDESEGGEDCTRSSSSSRITVACNDNGTEMCIGNNQSSQIPQN